MRFIAFKRLSCCLAAISMLSFCAGITEATQSVTLAWNSNPGQGVMGYVLYYGAATGTYTNAEDVGNATNAVVAGLVDGVTYFFAVTAYNSVGLESDFSAESSFTTATTGGVAPPPGSSPVVATMTATDITPTSGTFNGLVNPGGNVTTAWFDCGATTNYGTRTPAQSLGSGTSPISIHNGIVGLLPGTTCHFRVVAGNAGTTVGADSSFTTPALAPTLTTQPAKVLSSASAELNGTVNPNGAASAVYFQYGIGTTYGQTTALIGIAAGNTTSPVVTAVAGLLPGATYHFRIVGTNQIGALAGPDLTFTTPPADVAPAVTTQPATAITPNTATLNGLVNPNGGATIAWFQIGLSTAYGTVTPAQAIGSGTAALTLSNPLGNLSPGATYHYRIVASNAVAAVFGADRTFAASPVAPTVTARAATAVTSRSATLNALVNPNGVATTGYFEYGLTASYGSKTPVITLGAGGGSVPASSAVSALSPSSTYHVRFVATNSVGTTVGADSTFITSIRRKH